MKALLLFLLTLTVAPSIDAQEKVLLTNVVWRPSDVPASKVTYEDGDCGEMTAGYDQKLWHIDFELPFGEPDSVSFVVNANCEFDLHSGYTPHDQWPLGFAKNISGTVTMPYQKQPNKKAYCVGISVSAYQRDGAIQYGTVCLDAAYAWYSTLSIREQIRDRMLDVYQVNWYGPKSIDARSPEFFGTLKELKASGKKGMFFSILGKHYVAD
jgi:hypothetical protein